MIHVGVSIASTRVSHMTCRIVCCLLIMNRFLFVGFSFSRVTQHDFSITVVK